MKADKTDLSGWNSKSSTQFHVHATSDSRDPTLVKSSFGT